MSPTPGPPFPSVFRSSLLIIHLHGTPPPTPSQPKAPPYHPLRAPLEGDGDGCQGHTLSCQVTPTMVWAGPQKPSGAGPRAIAVGLGPRRFAETLSMAAPLPEDPSRQGSVALKPQESNPTQPNPTSPPTQKGA